MAYNTPHTAVTGATITASGHNTSIRDNIEYLKGRAGTIAFEAGASFNGAVLIATGGLSLPSTGTGGITCAAGDVTINRAYLGGGNGATGYIILGNDTAKYIGYDGAQHVIRSAKLNVQGDIYTDRSFVSQPTLGFIVFGTAGTQYVGWDGSKYSFGGNTAWHSGNMGSASGLDADKVDGFHAGNATGQVPVSNGTLNTNLNADLLDGLNSGNGAGAIPINNNTLNTNLYAQYADGLIIASVSRAGGNAANQLAFSNGTKCTNLNADLLDGLDSTAFAILASSPTFTGVVTSAGLTSSGAVSGTTGSFSGAVGGSTFQPSTNVGLDFGGGYFIQTTAGPGVAIATGGTIRFEQRSASAIFSTPGTYVTSWTAVSDRRLKTDIELIPSALDRLAMLRPVTYIPSALGIAEGMTRGARKPGLIAQELADVFPDLVEHRRGVDPSETYLTADYVGLVPYMLAALIELRDDVRTISARLAA